MDALTGALLRGVEDLEPQVCGYVGAAARIKQQVAVGVLDVRQTIDIELENLGRVLDTEAVTRAKSLVDPDLQWFPRWFPRWCRRWLRQWLH